MSKLIIAIDPGTTQSASVLWDGHTIIQPAAILPNDEMLKYIDSLNPGRTYSILAIEWIESYGMAVGKEVFETCRWCGRFQQEWGGQVEYVTRKRVKQHICHTSRATDANVRQALIDRFGQPGTSKQRGLTYGLKKDMWSAFAVAVTLWDTLYGFDI